MFNFYTPWICQKVTGFLMFTGAIEMEQWLKNGYTAWKVSKYRILSGPYFPVLGLNTGKYGPEKTLYLDTFRKNSVFGHFSRSKYDVTAKPSSLRIGSNKRREHFHGCSTTDGYISNIFKTVKFRWSTFIMNESILPRVQTRTLVYVF